MSQVIDHATPSTPAPTPESAREPDPSQTGPAKSLLEGVFAIDLRSMAVMRVVIALILLADLINRSPAIRWFYTDNGVLPRAALAEKFSSPWTWSFHMMNG